ncbi:nucleotide-binding universal stress UspA family protein [Agromyces flavus]|uniref:Nucleotide-binding universal stress UspA family protein n=1 Tax=Agromyces flavus TaxID=589382 RepID=A0ABT1KIR2_9MICO|nr:universal stress protein [Agromyces flavus]MCP2366773.1 nucleotide-binding universal stress UspA family protein [Agromyces flavus]GGI45341.1 universal stress protein [Agromyces flavus]
MVFTRIVVGWDGTPNSEAALRWALAQAGDASIALVHVIPGADESSEYLRATGDLSAARVDLMERADAVRAEHPGRTITTSTVHGRPEKELGGRLDHDTLVIVGTSAHGRETAWTLGARLAGRRGKGCVAVIPPDWDASPRSTVVVGVDGSIESKAAIRVGAEHAARTGQELALVHAWVVPTSWNSAYVEYLGDVEMMEQMRRDVLDDALEYARSYGAEPSGRLERGGPAPVLAELSERASVVVVGSHATGGMARFLLGSVSHDLLLTAAGPVIVVSDIE